MFKGHQGGSRTPVRRRAGPGAGGFAHVAYDTLNEALNPRYDDSDREGILGMKDPNEFYQHFNLRKRKHVVRLVLLISGVFLLTYAVNMLIGPSERTVRLRQEKDILDMNSLFKDELDFMKSEHESAVASMKKMHEKSVDDELHFFLSEMEKLQSAMQHFGEQKKHVESNATMHEAEAKAHEAKSAEIQANIDRVYNVATTSIQELDKQIQECKKQKAEIRNEVNKLKLTPEQMVAQKMAASGQKSRTGAAETGDYYGTGAGHGYGQPQAQGQANGRTGAYKQPAAGYGSRYETGAGAGSSSGPGSVGYGDYGSYGKQNAESSGKYGGYGGYGAQQQTAQGTGASGYGAYGQQQQAAQPRYAAGQQQQYQGYGQNGY